MLVFQPLYLDINPGTQVVISHPWLVKSFNREETVGKVNKQQDYKSKNQLEGETFVPYQKCDQICN